MTLQTPPGLDLRDSDAVDRVSSEVWLAMQTVHWADLFLSMDRFLVELAHHYGPFVYLALGLIFLIAGAAFFTMACQIVTRANLREL